MTEEFDAAHSPFKSATEQYPASAVGDHYPTILPTINALPEELLLRIFLVVHAAESCCLQKNGPLLVYHPRVPELFSLVCSRWRHVSLRSSVFWSHIDLAPSHSLGEMLLTRGKVFAARAGHAPLAIHINDRTFSGSHEDTDFYWFCTSIAARTWSLELGVLYTFGAFQRSVLDTFFLNCTPGTLNRLAITDRTVTRPHGFLTVADSKYTTTSLGGLSLEIDIPQRQLEDLLFPITVLRLDGVYPYWTSQAYSGLVELRATCTSPSEISITEFQLVGILSNCPELRILCYDLQVMELSSGRVVPEPVHLNDLEVLLLKCSDFSQQEALLRLLLPGSKPLQMSTKFSSVALPTSNGDKFTRFFQRSNITHLYIEATSNGAYPWFDDLLRLLPNLQALTLCNFSLIQTFKASHCEVVIPRLRLDTLRLKRCVLWPNGFKQANEGVSIQEIALWECAGPFGADGSHPKFQRALAEIYPMVKFSDNQELFQVEDWD